MVGVNKASSLSTSWGTHSLTCLERSKSPFYIYSGNTLFEQYFTEDMGASMSTLGVFIIQIYIFLKNLWTAWRKISQTAPTKRLSCWWHLAWSIVGEIFPTACATEGHKLQEFSSQLHFPVHFLMYFCGRIHNGTQDTGRLQRHLLYVQLHFVQRPTSARKIDLYVIIQKFSPFTLIRNRVFTGRTLLDLLEVERGRNTVRVRNWWSLSQQYY